jgi:hypothetical protein
MSATVQKHYTGISLPRYTKLVYVEYPLALLTSVLTWAAIPATFIYMCSRVGHSVATGTVSQADGIFFLVAYVLGTVVIGVVIFGIMLLLLEWARRKPSTLVRWYKKNLTVFGHSDRYEASPEKFPGPIAMLKKWILSMYEGTTSEITWDSGKRDRENVW